MIEAVVVDWGGVLTASLDPAMALWAVADNVDWTHFAQVLTDWRPPRTGDGSPSPLHRLERGELAAAEFEAALAAALAAQGSPVEPAGLLSRILAGLQPLEADMVALIRRLREAGVATALLSNSWGEHYPEELWDGLFDVVVISGRVGMRKPDARIFRHTCELLDRSPARCVMIDDLPANVDAAVEVGMVGLLHSHPAHTTARLADLGVLA